MLLIYSDNFPGTSFSSDWIGPNGGTWLVSGNILSCTSGNDDSVDPVGLIIKSSVTASWPNTLEVRCLVRVDGFFGGVSGSPGYYISHNKAGVTIGNNFNTCSGASYVFNETINKLAVYDENSQTLVYVNDTPLTCSTGIWYHFKLRYVDGDGLYGKMWPQSGTEPSDWQLSTGYTASGKSPGVMAGSQTTVSFAQFEVYDWMGEAPNSSVGLSIFGCDTLNKTGTLAITGNYPSYQIPLSITGKSVTLTQLPLVALGASSLTGGSTVPLFTSSWYSFNDGPHGFNLFLKQSDFYRPFDSPPPLPMFVRGTTGVEYNSKGNFPSLYINGFVYYINKPFNLFINNDVVESKLPFIITGDVETIFRSYNSLPLSIKGYVKNINDLSLFIQNSILPTNNTINPVKLFISGPNRINEQVPPLFIQGANYQLFTNPLTYLYLFAGDRRCEVMGMFLKVEPAKPLSFSVPIATNGSNFSGNYKSIPLSIIGSTYYRLMNLVIKGKDEGGQSRIIRLTIKGGNPPIDNKAPLVLFNDNEWAQLDGPLFIKGDGVNMDHLPLNTSVGLYIQRGPQDGITLVMWNPGIAGTLSFHIHGSPSYNSSLPMFVRGFGDTLNVTAPLTIYGNIFTGVNGTRTLAIPNVVGFTPESADLYTNGFNY